MTELTPELIAALGQLPASVGRLERALLGDPTIGHKGLVQRTERLEVLADGIHAIHNEIEGRRKEGDARAHNRVDQLEIQWRSELKQQHDDNRAEIEQIKDDGRRVEKKVDRLIYVFLGAGAVTGGGLGFLIREMVGAGL
ncbi:MAG: hypothetical protein Q8P61_09680 [Candidatus Nanopelagicales bacterium]|nr:hypothetical protein [Candidatus Nanopelagicales bacterium]